MRGRPDAAAPAVAAGCVDDLLLTVAPLLAAGDAPSPLRGASSTRRRGWRCATSIAPTTTCSCTTRCDAAAAPARPHLRRSQPGRPLLMGIVNADAGLVLRRRAPRHARRARSRTRSSSSPRAPTSSTSAASRASPTRRRDGRGGDRARRAARRAPRGRGRRGLGRHLEAGGRARRRSSAGARDAQRRQRPARPALADARGAHGRGARGHAHARRAQAGAFPDYDDVVGDVEAFLRERIALARARGVADEQLVLDPGPDFAKTPAQTVAVLRALDRAARARPPAAAGASRASTSSARSPGRPPAERLAGTLAALRHGPSTPARRSCACTTSPPCRLPRRPRGARRARRGAGVRRRATTP